MFFRNSLTGFSVFIYLTISSSIIEALLASEKDFEQFFSISLFINLEVFLKRNNFFIFSSLKGIIKHNKYF